MRRFLRLFPYVRSLESELQSHIEVIGRLSVSLYSVNSVLRQTQDKLRQLTSPDWSLVQGMTNDQAFELGRKQGIQEGFVKGKAEGIRQGTAKGVGMMAERIGPWTKVILPDGQTLERDAFRIQVVDGRVVVYDEDEVTYDVAQTLCQFTAQVLIPPAAASR